MCCFGHIGSHIADCHSRAAADAAEDRYAAIIAANLNIGITITINYCCSCLLILFMNINSTFKGLIPNYLFHQVTRATNICVNINATGQAQIERRISSNGTVITHPFFIFISIKIQRCISIKGRLNTATLRF